MKAYASENIRNIGLFAHSGAGKTSLADAFLFVNGTTPRLLSVDEENSTFDTDNEEKQRRTTVGMHLGIVEWNKVKINVIDTPGALVFQSDIRYACEPIDVAFLVISAADGVEVGTEKAWAVISNAQVPCVALVNKMDRDHANMDKVLSEIRESLEARPSVIFLPIGSADNFKGVVNIPKKEAYLYDSPGSTKFTKTSVPDDLEDKVEELYNELVENVAESDESLMEKYFEGELTEEDLQVGLRSAIASGEILPVLCGSAKQIIAVPQILDFITDYVPNPLQTGAREYVTDDDVFEVQTTNDGPFAGFVFKTFVDPFAGKLTCIKIRRGSLAGSGELYNSTLNNSERYSSIFGLQGKHQVSFNQANAGDIAVISKLKTLGTGHSVCAEKNKIKFPRPTLPSAAISFSIQPKTQSDEEKLGLAVHRIMEEDGCIDFHRDEITHEQLLSGLGVKHIESVLSRLKERFNVELTLGTPKIPYKETIKTSAKARGRHKKQTGGRGQFGDCHIELEPGERGTGFVFVDKIVGGSIPRNFIPAIKKGIKDTLKKGIVVGYPVVDIRVICYDGSHHPVDSSDMAFQIAGSLGFKEAAPQCNPVILEPVMLLEITTPDDYLGDVMGDLNSRRGKVLGMGTKGKNQIIRAQVPLAEAQQYTSDLKSLTSARGTFTVEFDHYAEVPHQIQEKLIAEAENQKEDD